MERIPERMRYMHRLIVFLFADVSPLEKNLPTFLIVSRLIDWYTLTSSTDAIVTMYKFISNYLGINFGSDAYKMATFE